MTELNGTTAKPHHALTETQAFELYCAHVGDVQDMLRTVKSLSPEDQEQYPSKATLYRWQDEHHWKERFSNIRRAMMEKEQEKVSMTYERINKLCSLVMTGALKRAMDAINEGNLSQFNYKLLDTVWRIQRTERGLSTAITHQYGMGEDAMDMHTKRLDDLGYGGLADAVKKMSPEYLTKLMQESGIEMKEPAILKRD